MVMMTKHFFLRLPFLSLACYCECILLQFINFHANINKQILCFLFPKILHFHFILIRFQRYSLNFVDFAFFFFFFLKDYLKKFFIFKNLIKKKKYLNKKKKKKKKNKELKILFITFDNFSLPAKNYYFINYQLKD